MYKCQLFCLGVSGLILDFDDFKVVEVYYVDIWLVWFKY